jgi:hypothetical protein
VSYSRGKCDARKRLCGLALKVARLSTRYIISRFTIGYGNGGLLLGHDCASTPAFDEAAQVWQANGCSWCAAMTTDSPHARSARLKELARERFIDVQPEWSARVMVDADFPSCRFAGCSSASSSSVFGSCGTSVFGDQFLEDGLDDGPVGPSRVVVQVQDDLAELVDGELCVGDGAAQLGFEQVGSAEHGGGAEGEQSTVAQGEVGPRQDLAFASTMTPRYF